MKKWFVILLSALLLQQGVVFAQEAPALPFEIDTVATAQAPWKVGEVTSSARCSLEQEGCYRIFLGVTAKGQTVLQEFYSEGKAELTDPFLVKSEISWEEIRELDKVKNPLEILDSNLVARYPAGAKYVEIILDGKGGAYMVKWTEDGEMIQEKTVSGL